MVAATITRLDKLVVSNDFKIIPVPSNTFTPRKAGGYLTEIMNISILGTRGIPAQHGGFETFAERLALHLKERDWNVCVYCQEDRMCQDDYWQGVRRKRIFTRVKGSLGSIFFDFFSTIDAAKEDGLILTLGYNTAVFGFIYLVLRRVNIVNMDGIEWRRGKWSMLAKAWLRLNERFACLTGDYLIADHPCIGDHLKKCGVEWKTTVIPYGADSIESGNVELIDSLGISAHNYVLVVARAEPENSILEIVQAFSRRKRGLKMVVLGSYTPKKNSYHASVMKAASSEVVFLGSIYDRSILDSIRFFSTLYVHGHTVGGTNPSLVESLGAGNPVLAHDNPFNRWVAGPEQRFFKNTEECAAAFDALLSSPQTMTLMSAASRKQHADFFTWQRILSQYEELLKRALSTSR